MRGEGNWVLENRTGLPRIIFCLPETAGIAYTDKTSLQKTNSSRAWIVAMSSKGL
jgi:hypothetical protein